MNEEEIEVLKKELDENYYPTCKAISAFIKKRFNKDFTPNGLRLLLKKLEYTYKQVTVIPGKADAEAQKKFVKKIKRIKKRLSKTEGKMYFWMVFTLHTTREALKFGVEKVKRK